MPQPIPTLHWVGDIEGHLVLIDQTRLPGELVELACCDVPTLVEAIRSLRVRGIRPVTRDRIAGVYRMSMPRTS